MNKSYDDNIIFEEALNNIHNKYKINNGSFENYYGNNIFLMKYVIILMIRKKTILNLNYMVWKKQFNISKLEIPVFLNYDGIGKAIGTIKGIKLYFHLNEKDLHHNSHIHCKYSEKETKVEIETLNVLDKPFKKSKMDVIKKFLSKHKEELLNYWYKVIIDEQPIELKIEI